MEMTRRNAEPLLGGRPGGKNLDEQEEGSGNLVPGSWKSSSNSMQRIHSVEETPGNSILVQLRLEGACESDWWAHRGECLAPRPA